MYGVRRVAIKGHIIQGEVVYQLAGKQTFGRAAHLYVAQVSPIHSICAGAGSSVSKYGTSIILNDGGIALTIDVEAFVHCNGLCRVGAVLNLEDITCRSGIYATLNAWCSSTRCSKAVRRNEYLSGFHTHKSGSIGGAVYSVTDTIFPGKELR